MEQLLGEYGAIHADIKKKYEAIHESIGNQKLHYKKSEASLY